MALLHDILQWMAKQFAWWGGVVILVILPSLEEVERRFLALAFVPFVAFICKRRKKGKINQKVSK